MAKVPGHFHVAYPGDAGELGALEKPLIHLPFLFPAQSNSVDSGK